MLTLLPALLVIFGRWVFWPMIPHVGLRRADATRHLARVGRRIAVPTASRLGRHDRHLGHRLLRCHPARCRPASATRSSTPTRAVGRSSETRSCAEHFRLGDAAIPVTIVANAESRQSVSRGCAAGRRSGRTSASPRSTGDVASISATLSNAPDSQAAYDTIERLRDAVHAVDGADALVGGYDRDQLSTSSDASQHDRHRDHPADPARGVLHLDGAAAGGLAPMILIATVVLSFGAASGISALVFHHIFGFAGADSLAAACSSSSSLVALGIDYNIFLMTRVREEALKYGTRPGSADRARGHRWSHHLGRPRARRHVRSRSAPCRWWPSQRSASRSPSACCSTRSSCVRCWSPPSTSMSAGTCGGRARSAKKEDVDIDEVPQRGAGPPTLSRQQLAWGVGPTTARRMTSRPGDGESRSPLQGAGRGRR